MKKKITRVPIECPEYIQEALSKSLDIKPELGNEIITWLRNQDNEVLNLMFRYADYHEIEPRIVIDPYKVDICSKVPPWDFYKHMYLCVYVHNEDYKNVYPQWFSALRYNPWSCSGKGPDGAGYTESESFKFLFLNLGIKFGPRHITSRRYKTLREAIKSYWDFNKECNGIATPLAYSAKRGKQRFLIERNVGHILFKSPSEMLSFFYPSGKYYGQTIEELISIHWDELVNMVKNLPNGSGFVE